MEDSCWCMIDIDGQNVRAKIMHKNRGKFRIENDEGGQQTQDYQSIRHY
jgi:hypothetical protein